MQKVKQRGEKESETGVEKSVYWALLAGVSSQTNHLKKKSITAALTFSMNDECEAV